MPRPRAFDTDAALARVRDALWAGGVHATSIADLCAATGLSAGSLYKAFTDKPTLVLRVLDEYLVAGLAWTEAMLAEGDGALDGVEAWLRAVADLASADSPQRGCFAVQCASELAERDPAVRARLAEHDARLRALVEGALGRVAAAGRRPGDPLAHARLLLTGVNGLQLDARKGLARADAHAVVDVALAALFPPAASGGGPSPRAPSRGSPPTEKNSPT